MCGNAGSWSSSHAFSRKSCARRVQRRSDGTIALTCKSWNRFAKFTLQSADFDAFWKRVLWGMAPRSMLHPECASKERLPTAQQTGMPA